MRVVLALLFAALAAAQIIPGEWFVVLQPEYAQNKGLAEEHFNKARAGLKRGEAMMEPVVIGTTYAAYGLYLEDEEIASIQAMEGVKYVEPNGWAYTTDVPSAEKACTPVGPGTSWGVRRSTQWDLTPNDQNVYGSDEGGDGATVYILDTGIRLTHASFGGRAYFGANFAGGGNGDVHGHGTHCAGTAVGTGFGLAINSQVYNVKVLSDGGSGSWDGIVRGIQWVVEHQQARGRAIISMSLGGGGNNAVDDAVRAAYNGGQGVLTVCAAGNNNGNACNFSPARACALSVGSTASNDARSTFSNFGTCTHIFAPGTNIVTALTRDWGNANRVINPGAGSPNVLAYYACSNDPRRREVTVNATRVF